MHCFCKQATKALIELSKWGSLKGPSLPTDDIGDGSFCALHVLFLLYFHVYQMLSFYEVGYYFVIF